MPQGTVGEILTSADAMMHDGCSQGNSLAYASYCLLYLCLVSRGVARLACAMGYKKSTVESLLNLHPGKSRSGIR